MSEDKSLGYMVTRVFPWWLWPSLLLAFAFLVCSLLASMGQLPPMDDYHADGNRLVRTYSTWWYLAPVAYVCLVLGAVFSGLIRGASYKSRLVWPTMLCFGVIMALTPEQRINGIIMVALAAFVGYVIHPFVDRMRGRRTTARVAQTQ